MRRVCLFAQYDPRQRISVHVIRYIGHLQRCGYETVVACSGSGRPPLADRDAVRATGATLVCRPNQGLDFGAWQQLVRDGHTEGADAVLLANDSVFGPFADLKPIFERMEERRYDVWGMVESRQHTWHLQSWFLHFSAEAFNSPSIRQVFNRPFARMTKDEIIFDGELALGPALRREGFRCGAVSSIRTAAWASQLRPTNLTHLDWRHHLVSGQVPFLKADLLRANAMNIPWIRHWERVVRDASGAETDDINDHLFSYTGRERAYPGQPFPVPVETVKPHVLAWYVLSSRDHLCALRAYLAALRPRRRASADSEAIVDHQGHRIHAQRQPGA